MISNEGCTIGVRGWAGGRGGRGRGKGKGRAGGMGGGGVKPQRDHGVRTKYLSRKRER